MPELQIMSRTVSEGDNHPLEDACGFAGTAAWMIDGATQVLEPLGLPGATDPGWYAAELNRELSTVAASGSAHGPAKLLDSALQRVDATAQNLVGDERLRFPSAAVSVLTVDHEAEVQVLSLADCHVVIALRDGGVVHVCSSPERPGAKGPAPSHDEEVAQRLRRNTPAGLWVARREPEAARHALLECTQPASAVVLASDGAWRAVELGLVCGPEEFLRRTATPLGSLTLQTELREHQERIGERADDSSILALSIYAP